MQAREVADVEAYGFFVCFEMCLRARGAAASSSFMPASRQVLPENTYIKYKKFFLVLQLMLEQSLVIRKDVARDVEISLPPLLYPHPKSGAIPPVLAGPRIGSTCPISNIVRHVNLITTLST